MIRPELRHFQLFGLAVAVACEQAQAHLREGLSTVTAEEVWLSEGDGARLGFPLSCGRLPVAVGGVACLISSEEARRYVEEFRTAPPLPAGS